MLKNLFRKRTIEELRSEADEHFAAGRFGDAKLAYDRLAERAAREKTAQRDAAEAQAALCCDKLAEARLAEAERMFAIGEHALAREELRHGLDTARSASVRARLTALGAAFDRAETVQARAEVAPPPLSDEERLMLITGSWEPEQALELEGYGEPLLEALLALERGDAKGASALIDGLFQAATATGNPPRYLWLERARAALADKALDAGEAALRQFVATLAAEQGGTPRLLAHRELARIAHERGDRDAAVAEFEAAAEALSEDPRAYLDLGNYLRLIERPREAIEVLQLCEGMFPEGKVEWPVTLELGLACAEAGESERGIALLEQVVRTLLEKGERDLPPPAAIALAGLHERGGNPARAADLYRLLTTGSDVDNHARYFLEAARLLDVLELTDEAARMRAKAQALGGAAPA